MEQQSMEERLWDFIDGISLPEEQRLVRELLQQNAAWQRRYAELTNFDELIGSQELEMPSMRFTKNVMEQIARLHVAPATKQYINKHVIRGLTAFFLCLIAGFLVYSLGQLHWTAAATDNLVPKYNLNADQVNWGRALSNTYVNVFLLVNVILGLFVLDRFLQQRRKSA